MPTDPDRLKRYLVCETPDKQWVTDKLIYLLSGEAIIPPFSAAAIKLGQLSRDENCQMEDVAEVIQMDAGLASDIIKVASSVGFAARRISSIDQALMMIGMTEVRRIALSMGVMKNFEHLKSQVDWNSFWLHSIMVARLTERVAAAYRPPSGSEYLAGLLHDCGKLVLEHYFPEDFDRIIIRATERGSGHVSVEREFIGVSHAQIGAGVCECLQAHLEVIRAVWYHHDPFDAEEGSQPDNSKFLAACVGVADALTNYKQINIYGARIMDYDKPFEELPEWQFLAQYQMSYGLDLDLDFEEEKAREDLKSFGLGGDDNGDGE